MQRDRLFTIVMIWTIITTVFAWLPLVRIVGRPEGYQWGLFGLSGSGTDGPFGIFILLTVYAFSMVYSGWRGPRGLFHALLLVWHTALATGMVYAAVQSGFGAAWQGQGLHFSIPMPIAALPILILTVLAFIWVLRDRRRSDVPTSGHWTSTNTRKLVLSVALLPLAITLFRLGTNYNWVTAVAILVTIVQWVSLLSAFEPQPPVNTTKPEAAR